MQFTETKLDKAYVIDLETNNDSRGFFARSFCKKEFQKNGIDFDIAQCNISFNEKKGILRGMHYQTHPNEEAKLLMCTRGSIYDVIIDLRPESKSYLQWEAIVLSRKNKKMLFIPEGFAHGFQTLEDKTEVFYQMNEFYVPETARGVRWNDPEFAITWPEDERVISIKDQNIADYRPNE